MSVSRTAHVTLNEPSDQIDLEAWLFGLSDSDNQTCAKGHQGRLADAARPPSTITRERQGDQSCPSAASLKPSHSRPSRRSSQMVATVKRRAELLVDQLRSRARRAPIATRVQRKLLI